jgi:hypothetical protein
MLITVSTAVILRSQRLTPAVVAYIQGVRAGKIMGIMMSCCTVSLREVVLQRSEFRYIRSITIAEQQSAFRSIRLQRAKQCRVKVVVQTVIAAKNAH